MKLSGLSAEWLELEGAKFLLKPLSVFDAVKLGEFLARGELGDAYEFACDKALDDWEGIEDDSGPVSFEKDKVKQLPIEVVASIAKEVIDANILGAKDEKN